MARVSIGWLSNPPRTTLRFTSVDESGNYCGGIEIMSEPLESAAADRLRTQGEVRGRFLSPNWRLTHYKGFIEAWRKKQDRLPPNIYYQTWMRSLRLVALSSAEAQVDEQRQPPRWTTPHQTLPAEFSDWHRSIRIYCCEYYLYILTTLLNSFPKEQQRLLFLKNYEKIFLQVRNG